jgi:hypothetical protein
MGMAATSVDKTRLCSGSYVCGQGAVTVANLRGDAGTGKLS